MSGDIAPVFCEMPLERGCRFRILSLFEEPGPLFPQALREQDRHDRKDDEPSQGSNLCGASLRYRCFHSDAR